MNKLNKKIIYIVAGIICLTVILFAVNYFVNHSYRNQIPTLPDLTSFSGPVREQLSMAHKNAYDNPTCDNIGILGMTYHSGAEYELASQCYKLAIKKDQSEWKWYYYLAYLNQEMGDSKSAIENLNAVIKINPEVYYAWYYLGNAYLNIGSEDKAEEAFKKIVNLAAESSVEKAQRVNYSPLPISAKYELARMYLNSSRLNEAENILKSIVQKNKTIGPVYRLLGNVYAAMGDSLLSKKNIIRAQDLAEVTTINDTLIDRLTLLSRSELYLPKQIDDALKTANPEWALQLFNHALLYLPEDKYLISKAIKYFLRMDSGKNALPLLDKNLKNFIDNFNELSEVAEMLFKRGFYKQAIPYFVQANRLKPESDDLVSDLALSFWMIGEKDTSEILMNELYEKNKNNPKILVFEVNYMLKTNNFDKAKYFLSKLKPIGSQDPKTPKLTGIIAEKEGDTLSAINFYQEAFKRDSKDLETTQKLVSLLIERKMWSEAKIVFIKSLENNPNSPFLLERYGALLVSCPDAKQRNLKEGLELSERAFFHISSPSSTIMNAGKSLAQAYATLGDFKNAVFYMNVTLNLAQTNRVSEDYMQLLLRLAGKIKQISEKQNPFTNPAQ